MICNEKDIKLDKKRINDLKSLMTKEQKDNYERFIKLFAEIIRKHKGK